MRQMATTARRVRACAGWIGLALGTWLLATGPIIGGARASAETLLAQAPPPASKPGEPAQARLREFQGPWVGHTAPGQTTERGGTVNIQTLGSGGFTIRWTSFEGEGQGRTRKVVTRDRSLRFEPTERAGLWRAVGSGDPVRGFAAWAFIHGRTLSIRIAEVSEDGELEQQTYDRTLTSTGLKLRYRRLLDGETARSLELDFLRL